MNASFVTICSVTVRVRKKISGIFSVLVVFCMDRTRSFYNLRRRSSTAAPEMSSSSESGGVHVRPELSPVMETSSTSPTETGAGSEGTVQPGDFWTDVVPTLSVRQTKNDTTDSLLPPQYLQIC